MSKYASNVVKQAQSWVGKKESDGSHKEIIDVYNSYKPLPRGYKVKYTDAWCASFVSAVAIKLGYTNIIPPECSCPKMIELFKNIGSWDENDARTPKAGDIIFYDWEDSGNGDATGGSDHVGIVEKVSSGTITVIEGNYNNSVARRTIQVNGKYIRGYGVPKYDAEPTKTTTQTTYIVKKGDSLWKISKEQLGDGSKYKEIMSLNNLETDTIYAGQVLKIPIKSQSQPVSNSIKVGSTVKVKNGAKTYTGGKLASFVYDRQHKVKQIDGERVVITYLGVTVAAVNINDLILV